MLRSQRLDTYKTQRSWHVGECRGCSCRLVVMVDVLMVVVMGNLGLVEVSMGMALGRMRVDVVVTPRMWCLMNMYWVVMMVVSMRMSVLMEVTGVLVLVVR